MNKFWLVAMLAALVALPFSGCGDDDDSSDPDGGDTDTDTDSDSDTDTDTDSDTDTDTDTDTDADSTVVVTLDNGDADAGPDAATGFIDECETTLGGSGDESYGYGSDGVIKWGITNTAIGFQGEVYTQYGAPTAPGTYMIDATEADYETCGICLLVMSPDFSTTYMPVADSGSITFNDYNINAPVGEEFSGTFDVLMQEVTIDGTSLETTPVSGGCQGQLSGTWSGTVGDFPDGK